MNRIIDLKHHRIISASCLRKLSLSLARKFNQHFLCWIVPSKSSQMITFSSFFSFLLGFGFYRLVYCFKVPILWSEDSLLATKGNSMSHGFPQSFSTQYLLFLQAFLLVKLINLHSLINFLNLFHACEKDTSAKISLDVSSCLIHPINYLFKNTCFGSEFLISEFFFLK